MIFISLDKQVLFNAAFTGVIDQGGPSRGVGSTCAYKNDTYEGVRKCGVGHCLTPEALEACAEWEADVDGLLEHFGEDGWEIEEIDFRDTNFLQQLQAAHDEPQALSEMIPQGDSMSPYERAFRSNMDFIAKKYELETPNTLL